MIFNKKGNNPLLAAGFLFKGLHWLSKPELRAYILIPVLINLALYSTVLVLGYYYVNELIARFIPDWLQWLDWLLWPLFFIGFFIAGFFTFTLLANLIAAPFYGKLALKTQALLNGDTADIIEPPLMQMLNAELKRTAYFITRALPLLVLSVIPGLNLLAPFVWGLFGAWGMALEYFAYPLENQGVLFEEQKQLAKSVRLGALSFGGVAAFGSSLPFVNIIVAPAAVIGATMYVHELNKVAD
ncbi:sulfate transporter CysZ [Methylosoma difficile]